MALEKSIEDKLKHSLTEALDKWTDENQDDLEMFWGKETVYRMAEASMSVLLATKDVQDTIKQEGFKL